ncbi:MAG: nicotinate-nucleotide adenylyltransferase [Paracoccaceae bacterium]
MKFGFPTAYAGMTIGLLGGSFDPPHNGHVHITKQALRRLGLSQVWWLVSPGNPLKASGPQPMARRLAASRAIMQHPRVKITDIEARLGTRYTAETLAHLAALYPGLRFVWLMGADNLAQFHRWERWEDIAQLVPIAVLARPGQKLRAGLSPMAQRFARYRLPSAQARALALRTPPAWILLGGPMINESSTRLRDEGQWK